MSLPITAYLVTGPGVRHPVLSMVEAQLLKAVAPQSRTVEAMVLEADCARALRDQREAMQADADKRVAAAKADADARVAAVVAVSESGWQRLRDQIRRGRE